MKVTMRMILSLALVFATLLALSSCDLLHGMISEAGGAEDPETVTFSCRSGGDTLNITLPGDMKSHNFYMSPTASSDNYFIQIIPAAVSSITPNEGYDFPTMIQFFSAIYVDEGESISTDGTFHYVDRSSETEIEYYFFFESVNSFWAINFKADSDKVSAEDAFSTFKEWASTVSITSPASDEKSE